MNISPTDKRNFETVTKHHGLDADEIELCKTAYRADPESGRITYAALAAEIPAPIGTRVFVKLSPPPSGQPDRGEIRRG